MEYKKVLSLMLVGVVVLIAMILFIGPGEIFSALGKANFNYVLLAIIIELVITAFWASRWGVICTELNIDYKKIPLYLMLMVGLAINNITPSGRGGGEPVRAYLLSKSSNVPFSDTLATVLGDKLLDTFPFMVLAIFSMIYLIFDLHMDQATYFSLISALILFILVCVFIVFLCINETWAVKTIRSVFKLLRRFMKRDLDGYEQTAYSSLSSFQQSLKYLIKNRRVLTVALAISFLVWFLELLRVYVVFIAFGTHVSLGMIAAVFVVATLIGMVPALPGGLGAVDGLMILLYSMAGVPPSISTAATLVERLISYWMISIMGMLSLPYFGTGVLDEVKMET